MFRTCRRSVVDGLSAVRRGVVGNADPGRRSAGAGSGLPDPRCGEDRRSAAHAGHGIRFRGSIRGVAPGGRRHPGPHPERRGRLLQAPAHRSRECDGSGVDAVSRLSDGLWLRRFDLDRLGTRGSGELVWWASRHGHHASSRLAQPPWRDIRGVSRAQAARPRTPRVARDRGVSGAARVDQQPPPFQRRGGGLRQRNRAFFQAAAPNPTRSSPVPDSAAGAGSRAETGSLLLYGAGHPPPIGQVPGGVNPLYVCRPRALLWKVFLAVRSGPLKVVDCHMALMP